MTKCRELLKMMMRGEGAIGPSGTAVDLSRWYADKLRGRMVQAISADQIDEDEMERDRNRELSDLRTTITTLSAEIERRDGRDQNPEGLQADLVF